MPAATRLLFGLVLSTLLALDLAAGPKPMTSLPIPSSPATPALPVPPGQDFALLGPAFRADLADCANPMFLGLDEAQILANALGIGVEIYTTVPGAKQPGQPVAIKALVVLNEELLAEEALHIVLFKDRHFSLLEFALPDEDIIEYVHDVHGVLEGYLESGALQPGQRRPSRVPADGNCLITSLVFLQAGRFPEPGEVALLRALIASSLTESQVREGLKEVASDLINHAPDRPWENGRFAGYGPRVSALFAANPDFQAVREKVLAAQRAREMAFMRVLHTKPSPQIEADDSKELEAAIALSLSVSTEPDDAPDGGWDEALSAARTSAAATDKTLDECAPN